MAIRACLGKVLKIIGKRSRGKKLENNQRILIWSFFGFMVFLNYQAWMLTTNGEYSYADDQTISLDQVPKDFTVGAGDSLLESSDIPTQQEIEALSITLDDEVTSQDNLVSIKTDVFDILIDKKGATLQQIKLISYPKSKDRPDEAVELIGLSSDNFGLIQSGLRSPDQDSEPNHLANYETNSSIYELTDSGELIVPFYWEDGSGLKVLKRFRFNDGSYRVTIEHTVENETNRIWRGAQYSQLVRRINQDERSMFDVESFSFDGPVIYDGEKSDKLNSSDLADEGAYSFNAKNGWLGAIQHHFVSAIIPNANEEYKYQVNADQAKTISSFIGPLSSINTGERRTFSQDVFIGPKLQSQMEEISPSLKLTVDYGFLTILSDPLFWLLSLIYSFVNNWGFSIILTTLAIKLLFYKLTEKSGKSMAKMRVLAPRLKSIQERYKDNRTELGKATMELYKREKVNPAAGCMPMLIQMPFFLAFYWVLLESVEMRQAPFVFWLTDLSSKDPYFVLPLIMAGAMFFQTKLNPAPADPMQAKVMQIMPLMFSVMFAFFPSGLVLYWVTNTILSIFQQWLINKKYGATGST